MMMEYFSIFGSMRTAATLSSSLRASAVRSAELNAKFTVRSNDPGVRTLGVAVMPRMRRLTTGMAHCGSSAQTISSCDSSSADAVGAPSARERPQSSRYAYFTAADDFGCAGAAAAEVRKEVRFLGMGASVLGCR